MSIRRIFFISANYKVKGILKDIKECEWFKQLVLIVKSSISKRLLSFYASNVLNNFLITLGKLKALSKIT